MLAADRFGMFEFPADIIAADVALGFVCFMFNLAGPIVALLSLIVLARGGPVSFAFISIFYGNTTL